MRRGVGPAIKIARGAVFLSLKYMFSLQMAMRNLFKER
jgi:hypothetical protein